MAVKEIILTQEGLEALEKELFWNDIAYKLK